jgi:transcriptional regulator with XRE-family HTH domain
MGRAGQALKQVLEEFSISQNKLAVMLRIDRSAIFKWVHEQRDPSGENIVEITKAPNQINPAAAQAFVQHYLGDLIDASPHPSEPEA